jgi:hypothetical protein
VQCRAIRVSSHDLKYRKSLLTVAPIAKVVGDQNQQSEKIETQATLVEQSQERERSAQEALEKMQQRLDEAVKLQSEAKNRAKDAGESHKAAQVRPDTDLM